MQMSDPRGVTLDHELYFPNPSNPAGVDRFVSNARDVPVIKYQ